MSTQSINPRTGQTFGPIFPDTSVADVGSTIEKARIGFEIWAAASTAQRAEALRAIADVLDANVADLVEIADLETGLGIPRLTGEVGRTSFQIREFARAISEGKFITPEVDSVVDAPLPVGHPEFLRALAPLGVVVVFGANNFPFAFSVLGGDTASALAAGCAVVAKAHPSHPQTSAKVFGLAKSVLETLGFPGVLSLIHGVEAGVLALTSPEVSAGAFTGSRRGGRALFDLAQARATPIPFYGELGSVNPVVALESALTDPKVFAAAYLDSLLLGNGQFCTNPSILFVPKNSSVIAEISTQVQGRTSTPFLSPATKLAHDGNRSALSELLGAELVVGNDIQDGGIYSAPAILVADIVSVTSKPESLELECFGPTGIVVTYDRVNDLLTVIGNLEGALTGSIFAAAADENAVVVSAAIAKKVGRLSWNSWPTGVAVTIGQQHGGPYPASTSPLHTSVGLHAISRFLRPITYQGFPVEITAQLL
ncbi:MAG: aldehyde dehydrogenase family protein [Actinomycetes bacterium]